MLAANTIRTIDCWVEDEGDEDDPFAGSNLWAAVMGCIGRRQPQPQPQHDGSMVLELRQGVAVQLRTTDCAIRALQAASPGVLGPLMARRRQLRAAPTRLQAPIQMSDDAAWAVRSYLGWLQSPTGTRLADAHLLAVLAASTDEVRAEVHSCACCYGLWQVERAIMVVGQGLRFGLGHQMQRSTQHAYAYDYTGLHEQAQAQRELVLRSITESQG